METENAFNQQSDEAATVHNAETAQPTDDLLEKEVLNELNSPIWSVISFEKCEAGGLNYQEAAQKLQELVITGVSGLCIVTNEAAQRIGSKIN